MTTVRTPTVAVISSQDDGTADYVEEGLRARGAGVLRINTELFPARIPMTWDLSSSDVVDGPHVLVGAASLDHMTSVYFRRPGPVTVDATVLDTAARKFAEDESRWALNGAWLSLEAFWLNHPFRIHVAEHKPLQLKTARRLGFNVPRTVITNDPRRAREFMWSCQSDIVAKCVRQAMIKRGDDIAAIYTNRLDRDSEEILDDVQYAPCILQERVAKRYEIRATVVGTSVLAAQIDSQSSEVSRDDWRRYDFQNTPYTVHELPEEVVALCLGLTRALGLHFGAIDLVLTPDDEYVFLEINPNGQWGWIEELTGLPIRDHICDILVDPPA